MSAEPFEMLVKRAKSCAARFDANGLNAAMTDLQKFMQVNGARLSKDPKRKRAVMKSMERLRDVCAVVSSALAEALADSTRSSDSGYGRTGMRDGAAAPVLARRYG